MTAGKAGVFTFLDWDFQCETGVLQLKYHDEKFGDFTETFTFPTVSAQRFKLIEQPLSVAIQCLHWMAGVSYYKTSLARHIQYDGLMPNSEQADWLSRTWQSGLAELAFEQQLPWLDFIHFPAENRVETVTNIPLKPRSLVAIGGGKDSLLSIELLKQQGEDCQLFMVGQSAFIQQVAAKTAVPLLQVKRAVDSKLRQVNQQGAYNGHVPITAINSCVAVVTALLADFDSVVFSNERSADEGNVIDSQGRSINHQYSKSFAFEQDFQNIIKQNISPNLDYFSLLRPFSELHIVKKFAALKPYFADFSSCNRNFHLAGSQNQHHHWCGQCPKCAFVFLCLAPFVSKDELLAIFKQDLLENQSLDELFAALLGIKGQKPFECVGEAVECRKALELLSQHPDWQNNERLDYWVKQVAVSASSNTADDIFVPSEQHQIPAKRNFLRVLSHEAE